MKLSEYPKTISDVSRIIFDLEEDFRFYQSRVGELDCQIEKIIADDASLKNEQQRKARRLDLTKRSDYCEAVNQLQDVKVQIESLRIDLQFYRDSFRVALLETRERIASLEVNQSVEVE